MTRPIRLSLLFVALSVLATACSSNESSDTSAVATEASTAASTALANSQGGALEVLRYDNGPGLPPDIQARLFEPYATNKPRGSGLGLAIVKKIAEEHDAAISVRNTSDGGARFELSLPLEAGQLATHKLSA